MAKVKDLYVLGQWVSSVFLSLLLFSLHFALLLFIIVFVVFENLLLFYYHFDKAGDTSTFGFFHFEEGKCHIFLRLRV